MSKIQERNLVAQSNKLVEGRYTLTKNELTLLVAMISLIDPNDKEFLTFSVTINELSRILEINKKSAIREFKKISRRLSKRTVEIDIDGVWEIYPWMSFCRLKGEVVTVKFNDELKPHLLELKHSGNFTQYRLGMTIGFKSNYTIRMYQLLREYFSKKIYTFEFSLEEFKKMMLGDNFKSYPVFKDFRRKVLDISKRELSTTTDFDTDGKTPLYKSDLNFDLTTRRTGRKISHLIFSIKQQQTKPTKTIQTTTEEKEDLPPIILEFHKFGVTTEQVQPYLEERGEEALQNTLQRIKLDQEAGKIKSNVGGYAFKLLKENAGQKTEREKLDEERKAKQKAKQVEEKKKQKEKARREKLKKDFEKEQRETIDQSIKGLPETILNGLIKQFEATEEFKNGMKAEAVANQYRKSGVSAMWGRSAFNTFLQKNFLGEELQTFENWLKFKNIKV